MKTDIRHGKTGEVWLDERGCSPSIPSTAEKRDGGALRDSSVVKDAAVKLHD